MAFETQGGVGGRPVTTVLVVDDEPDIRELVRYNLERDGFHVLEAKDGESACAVVRQHAPDALVLDLMLPGMSGLDVLRALRRERETAHLPVIVLTAKGSEDERILGLELGADDYVVKPFSPRELVTRVKTLLRRVRRSDEPVALVVLGPLRIDTARREVTAGKRTVSLTTTEFNLLRFLAERPGHALTRQELIMGAIGEDAVVTDRTIDAHVAAIRRKLGREASQWVETIRGYGYRCREH
ncbi:response regulator [Planctomycetota bacterium]